jgi:hypothetical protein
MPAQGRFARGDVKDFVTDFGAGPVSAGEMSAGLDNIFEERRDMAGGGERAAS